MIISLIAAVDLDGGIGKDGSVPWHLRADLRMFKRTTLGHHVLMGRKTFESIGKALPCRTNFVLSRAVDWSAPGVRVFGSLAEAFRTAEENGETELFIIGGGEIFSQAVDDAQKIYLTRVEINANCTVFFPELDPAEWKTIRIEHHPADQENDLPYEFRILERISPEFP